MKVKESYQAKAEAQLSEWLTWIEQFKTEPGPPQKKRSEEQELNSRRLDDCYLNAQGSLDALKSARGDHWEVAKAAMERAMIDLKRALDESGAGRAAHPILLKTHKNYVYEPFERKE